jgi:ADP-ribosylglycohydrolase
MTENASHADQARAEGALWGMFIGDALAMPVHWYYDRAALLRDYGTVSDYLDPRNPHPGSILHRSVYEPLNDEADILHDQARYWGQSGVHYHQNLKAGENTLNLQLVKVLLDGIGNDGAYDPDRFLERMVTFLRTPGNHRDTYAEEWLRHYFTRRAQGHDLRDCAVKEKHIGGLGGAVALMIHLRDRPAAARRMAQEHLQLTHKGDLMVAALDAVADILLPVLTGRPLGEVLDEVIGRGGNPMFAHGFTSWEALDDLEVIGRKVSTACYVEHSVPAVIHLARRYHDDPEAGLVANTMVGGDNCYRGVVLGALLGAANGLAGWPERWRSGLLRPPVLPAGA